MNDDASKLLDEQQQDASLADCWNMARQGKGNFVLSQGLLYRKDKVEGQPVCQLCVPMTRREPILKLARCTAAILVNTRLASVSNCLFTGQV